MTKKNKTSAKLTFSDTLTAVSALLIFTLLLKNAELAGLAVSDALKICVSMLIPSLFPLTVASEIMTESGAIEKLTRKFSLPVGKALGVSKNATVPYFLGLFGGYTSSCKSAALLYRNGKISKDDCESIIALSNMPSMAFLTGFVGLGIFKISTAGWVLWVITVLSTVVLGLINKIFFRKKTENFISDAQNPRPNKRFSKILVDAIGHSAYAMLIICACVVFFSVLIAVLKEYTTLMPIPESFADFFLGSLEITRGINSCANIESPYHRALACTFLIGWSGFCVHFQVIALCEDADISFKKYFIFKALQGLICAALAWVLLICNR